MNDSDPVDIELTKLSKPSHVKCSKKVSEDYQKKNFVSMSNGNMDLALDIF